jgi:hypothetical protein
MNLQTGEHHFEIQFHTSRSLHVKHTTHKQYEKLRQLKPVPESEPDRERLERHQRAAAGKVPLPSGIERILSFDRYAQEQEAAGSSVSLQAA